MNHQHEHEMIEISKGYRFTDQRGTHWQSIQSRCQVCGFKDVDYEVIPMICASDKPIRYANDSRSRDRRPSKPKASRVQKKIRSKITPFNLRK